MATTITFEGEDTLDDADVSRRNTEWTVRADVDLGRWDALARWERDVEDHVRRDAPPSMRNQWSWSVATPVSIARGRVGFERDVEYWAGTETERRVTAFGRLADIELGARTNLDLSASYRRAIAGGSCAAGCAGRSTWTATGTWHGGGHRTSLQVDQERRLPDGGTDVSYALGTSFRVTRGVATSLGVQGEGLLPDHVAWDVDGAFRTRMGDLEIGTSIAQHVQGKPRTSVALAMSWRYRIDVPVGYRADVGFVEGTVALNGLVAPSDVELRVGSGAVPVAEDGRFRTRPISPGAATVFFDTTTLPTNVLVSPAPVRKVDVRSGESVNVEFALVEAGAVQGRLTYAPPPRAEKDADRSVVYGSGRPDVDADVVRGRTVVLRQGSRVIEVQSDADGSIQREGLHPGMYEWELVRDPALRFFDVEPNRGTVVVEEGGIGRLDVRLVPQRRTIDIQDGPSLTIP
ncbi:MAG: hypothetical protein RI554_11290 [Trueperaceae bacterium]|nr:hypothetical protein [Trueperaceae bacterium]